MIKSMTGYGRGESVKNGIEALTEIRSFNNRFLEVSVRLPRTLAHCEQLVKEIVRKNIKRGRVNISISAKTENDAYLGLSADMELAKAYKRLLLELQEKLDSSQNGLIKAEEVYRGAILSVGSVRRTVDDLTRDFYLYQTIDE